MIAVRASRLALCGLALACASSTGPDRLGDAMLGDWGGQQVSLRLTASGGTLAYQCGIGTIDSAWTITQAGQFTASGVHHFGGGPVPQEGYPPHPARYAGQLRGQVFTLTVFVTDLQDTLGPFTLMRGGPAVRELCY